MMGSSFKDTGDHEHPHGKKTQEGVTRTDEQTQQLIKEKKERDYQDSLVQSGNYQNKESAAVAEAGASSQPGTYNNAQARALLKKGIENLTDAERKKLAYSAATGPGGTRARIGNAPLGLEITESLTNYGAGKRAEKSPRNIKDFQVGYFENLGITEPTDAEHRVMERAYKESKSKSPVKHKGDYVHNATHHGTRKKLVKIPTRKTLVKTQTAQNS